MTCLTLHLLKEGEEPGPGASVTVQWVPKQGWEVVVYQADDGMAVTLDIPDDGGAIVMKSEGQP